MKEGKKYRYTFDLTLRENVRINGIQNENTVNIKHYYNNEPQKIEHAMAKLIDGLSRDGYLDRTLYHLANFDATDTDANESVRATIDKYVAYLLKWKNTLGGRSGAA